MLNRIRYYKEKQEEGFSIIELAVVVSIILIITAISANSFRKQKTAGVDNSVEQDVKSAAVKIETWKAMNPGGEPVETLISNDKTNEDTVITLSITDGGFILTGKNPRGSEKIKEQGFVYNSQVNGL